MEAHGSSVLRLVRLRLIGGLFLLARRTNLEGGALDGHRWGAVILIGFII